MKLTVLNPGGSDPDQAFTDFAGPVNDRLHAPVNYHAYAACTGGSFARKVSSIDGDAVLLLLRRDLKAGLETLKALKQRGKTVAVSWKESGLHQVAEQLNAARQIELFREICARADGALSSTPELLPVYTGAGAKMVEFIPTPYPVNDARWNFSTPVNEREGVCMGTREFNVPSRNHLAALLAARELDTPVTVFNAAGRNARKQIEACGLPCLEIINGPIPYSEYLRIVARHRIVFQLDRSAVPGQVAGDALLCGIPCVGGDGAIERLIFGELCGHGRDASTLLQIVARLFGDEKVYLNALESSLAAAQEAVSFAVVAKKLELFFARILT